MASNFGTESAPEAREPTEADSPPVLTVHRFRLTRETSHDSGETWIVSHTYDYEETAKIAEFVAGIVAAL